MIGKEQQFVSSTEELDHILVEQLNSTKKHLKSVNRHLKLMPKDPWLNKGKIVIENRIQFFESMVENKELLKKRIRKRKVNNLGILSSNRTIYTWYRDMIYMSTFGYRMFLISAQNYLSLYTNKKKEKE